MYALVFFSKAVLFGIRGNGSEASIQRKYVLLCDQGSMVSKSGHLEDNK